MIGYLSKKQMFIIPLSCVHTASELAKGSQEEAKRSGKAETTSEFPVSKWLIYDHKHGITMFLVENSFLKLVNKQQQRPLILDMDS